MSRYQVREDPHGGFLTVDTNLSVKIDRSAEPRARLQNLTTADLIAQYDLAISSHAGRTSNVGPRQQRINYIVELLSDRADLGDAEALSWYEKK